MKLETLLSNITKYAEIQDPHGATHLPIYNTATFDLKKQSGSKVYDYSRSDNPTRNALETIFAKAENAYGCVCTNTGVGAVSLLFDAVLKTGDSVLVETDCYGGTHRLLTILKDKNNISSHYIDFSNLNLVENTIKNNQIKLVICESPTNPGLKIIDIQAIANICKKHHVLLAIDNSMATFASQKPLDLGADFSVFSATKFISGHGSVIAGAIASKDKLWHKKVAYAANAHGSAQSPMDVYLISLGLPSLHVRMKAQEESALKIAKFFENHSDVVKVRFPGLPSDPQYELGKKQMKIVPSLLTIDLISIEKAEKLVKNTKLFGEKVSFGTADSRLEIPSKMSHATFNEAQMNEKGLSLSTVRISIGLEDVDDLIEDIKQALK